MGRLFAVLLMMGVAGGNTARAMDYQMPALAAGSENRLGATCTSKDASPVIAENKAMTKNYVSEQFKDDPITFRETFTARDNSNVTVENRGCTDFVLNIKIDYTPWPRNPEPANMLSAASGTLNRLQMNEDALFPRKLLKDFVAKMQEMQQAGLTKKVFCLNPSSSGGCSTDVAISVRERMVELNYIDRH